MGCLDGLGRKCRHGKYFQEKLLFVSIFVPSFDVLVGDVLMKSSPKTLLPTLNPAQRRFRCASW